MATLVRTVVLACAKQRRADLGAVVEVLAGRGNAVEVVSGIEANPLPWEQVVARIGPNAIYVVCGDDVLTLERIAGLRATLQRGNVPLKHIWAGPINWAEPVQVLRHADQLLRMANGQMTQPLPQPPSEASGRTVLAPPPPRTAPPPLLPMNAAPPTHPMPTPMAGAPEPPIVVEGLGHRKPLLFAGAGVLLMGVILTAVLWGGDDDEPAKVAEATAAAKKDEAKPAAKTTKPAAKTAKPAAKTAKPAKEEEPAKQVDAAAPEPAKEAEPTPSPSPAPSPSPEPEDEPEVVAVAAEADAVAMPTSQGGGGGLGDVGEDPIVAEALRSQAIRALDILLISPEARVQKRRNWKLARHRFADAAAHCDELVVAGVDGWRLPNIGELRSLTTANILGRNATYWSDTKGDTYGNTRVIWAVHSHRMHSIGANSRGARTICVRDAV